LKRIALACGALSLGLFACEAILGLHDRTLRDAGGETFDASDATACDGEFCACTPHSFCDDFDFYNTTQDLKTRWAVPSFGTTLELGGSLSFDGGTDVLAPTPPNVLAARVFLETPLSAAGILVGLFDATAPNIVGIHVTVRVLPLAITPGDGGTEVTPDSGIYLFGGILALVDSTTKNGVGIALSEQGAYTGYALDVLSPNARLAQGKQFLNVNPSTIAQEYMQLDLVVAKHSSKSIPNGIDCTPGPYLSASDAGLDASFPTDPVVIVVTTTLTAPTCEVLGAELAFPDWLPSPVVMIGSVVKGTGVFSVNFDDFTLDFLTE
jgi:hypothetical protein